MIEFQNNYTTREESKRLLAIGLQPESADFFYNLNPDVYYGDVPHIALTIGDHENLRFRHKVPCWSLGRLIEIYNITTNLIPGMELDLTFEPENCTYIELVISSFEVAADSGLNDFSLLSKND